MPSPIQTADARCGTGEKNIFARCAEITAASEDIDKSKFCYRLSKLYNDFYV